MLCSPSRWEVRFGLDSHCCSADRDKWRNLQDILEEYREDLPADLLCGAGVGKNQGSSDSHVSGRSSWWAVCLLLGLG